MSDAPNPVYDHSEDPGVVPGDKGLKEPEALVKRLRIYRDELAAQGAGINQSHALGCDIAADTIERLETERDNMTVECLAQRKRAERAEAEASRLRDLLRELIDYVIEVEHLYAPQKAARRYLPDFPENGADIGKRVREALASTPTPIAPDAAPVAEGRDE